MTFVPNNAAICGGPGPHYSLGGGWSEFGPGAPTAPGAKPCPTCGGKGWYVRLTPRAEAERLREAFWAWESVAHSAESDPEERQDAAELWQALVDVMCARE